MESASIFTSTQYGATPWPATGVVPGLKEQYYHLLADRILTPARAHLTHQAYLALDHFFRYRLCLPDQRTERDAALSTLYRRLRFFSIPNLTDLVGNSVKLAELSTSLEESLLETLNCMGLTEGHLLTVGELEQAVYFENRFADRHRQFQHLIKTVRSAELISANGLPPAVISVVKLTVRALGAGALNLHIDALLELGYGLTGQVLGPALDAVELAERTYLDVTFPLDPV